MSRPNYKRLNFAGRLLKIAANPVAPLYIGDLSGNEFVVKGGSNYQFLRLLSGYFNFTWSVIPQNSVWGERDENGSWTGLIGSLASGQCDFATDISLRFDSGEKGEIIDLTRSYLQARVTFVTIKNEPIPLRGVLMMPFGWRSWSLIALTVLVLMTCGRVFAVVSRVYSDLDWLVFSALLQKAPPYRKQANHAIHFLLQLSWMTGFILLASYGGAIISSLTANLKVKNLDSVREFNELATSRKITPVMVATASYMSDFEKYRNTSITYDIILRFMVKVPGVRDGFLFLAREKLAHPNRNYAFIYPYKILQIWGIMLGRKYFHLLDTMDSAVLTDNYALAFKTNSWLVPHFDRV